MEMVILFNSDVPLALQVIITSVFLEDISLS